MYTIELKLKLSDTLKWEDAPVRITVQFNWTRRATELYADVIAQAIANEEMRQVRWNYIGVGQGHYFTPEQNKVRA